MGDATKIVLQELCDQIVHHLTQESSRDLQSTALVCDTLCISAQSQIFRHVEPDACAFPNGFLHDSDSATVDGVSALRRLTAILTNSPHLLRHIRSLSVLARFEILEFVSSLQFPLLQRITFNFQDTVWPDADVFHLSRGLIELPTLREVKFYGLRAWLGVSEALGMDLFPALFELCGGSFHSFEFSSIDPTSVVPITSVPRSTEKRAQIKRLQLDYAENIGDCPDFRAPGIKRLQMTGDLAFNVNLSDFSALTCLAINQSNYEAVSSPHPENRVATLVMHLMIFAFEAGHHVLYSYSFSFPAFDSFVANLPMSALQQVRVHIKGPSNHEFEFKLDSVPSPPIALVFSLAP
ncbi:hypothetical protein B0H17DRAFT_1335844 [Mycena rosella]|uniref:Uncharacterized protein n=1 Tax=Mycena rosella TaxID=1033263 RepID=A0AAD7G5A1_MYCRO|nr:hypothetical protein B0H17DRAFT_1335844 [Mycena rosella]